MISLLSIEERSNDRLSWSNLFAALNFGHDGALPALSHKNSSGKTGMN